MGSESKSFPVASSIPWTFKRSAELGEPGAGTLWAQLVVGYAPILAAVWTPDGPYKLALMLVSTVLILGFPVFGSYSRRDMGLVLPTPKATVWILGLGIGLAAAVPLAAQVVGEIAVPIQSFIWHSAWQYAIWATVQEFILQSFVFVRLETLLGGRRAVITTALLFSLAHIPSPVLTIGTFFGGLFFCEMFRRYRSIFPIGLVHALLGLTIAVSFANGILHHMRVGIGYLAYHS
jgi:membrane protease YdiL (CAAX protease family)